MDVSGANISGFPFLFGRAFIEALFRLGTGRHTIKFPFLVGRAFIEARLLLIWRSIIAHFPSFLEGLSLRLCPPTTTFSVVIRFPFLFGRAFIEAGCIVFICRVVSKISLPFWKGFH